MSHSFVSQPVAGGYDLQEFIENACADLALTRLDFAVAWIKRAGVDGVRPALEAFRARGGYVRGVVGISLGGTSRQGLTLARGICNELFVFHEPGRTFHPKVYLAAGDRRARSFVGSNNLTYGGLSQNYEAAVLSDLDVLDPADKLYFESVKGFIDGLVDEDELCREVTDEFMGKLLASTRYPLLDEDAAPSTGAEPVEGGAAPRGTEPEGEPLFGSAKRPKRAARRPPRRVRPTAGGTRRGRGTARPTAPVGVPPGPSPAAVLDPVVKRWFKPFKAADAQQLPRSSPSNTMTLVDGGHPINRSTFFRYVFFAGETWRAAKNRNGQDRELANIEAEVFVDGGSIGSFDFAVRHTPGYASGEGNRETELVYSTTFEAYLKGTSLVGRTAVIEKLQSGKYRIRFERVMTDPFLA